MVYALFIYRKNFVLLLNDKIKKFSSAFHFLFYLFSWTTDDLGLKVIHSCEMH